MKLADSHIHLFRSGYPGRYGVLFPKDGEAAVYAQIRSVHSIERALVVGYEGQPWSRGNNAYLARLAERHSWMTPLAYCAAAPAPRLQRLRSLWSQGFLGVSLYIFKRDEADALLQWTDDAVELLNEKRAIISINCPPDIASRLRPFFEKLGDTRILLSHLGLPGPMRGALGKLKHLGKIKDLPHVGVKLSGAYACNSYPHAGLEDVLDRLQNEFGESRLYWGSDYCPALGFVTFEQTIDAIKCHTWQDPSGIFFRNLQATIKRVKRAQA